MAHSDDEDEEDLYAVLGLAKSCTSAEVTKAYRRAALRTHPDKHAEHERPAAEIAFKKVAHAYQILSDPDSRRRYDHVQSIPRSSSSSRPSTAPAGGRAATQPPKPTVYKQGAGWHFSGSGPKPLHKRTDDDNYVRGHQGRAAKPQPAPAPPPPNFQQHKPAQHFRPPKPDAPIDPYELFTTFFGKKAFKDILASMEAKRKQKAANPTAAAAAGNEDDDDYDAWVMLEGDDVEMGGSAPSHVEFQKGSQRPQTAAAASSSSSARPNRYQNDDDSLVCRSCGAVGLTGGAICRNCEAAKAALKQPTVIENNIPWWGAPPSRQGGRYPMPAEAVQEQGQRGGRMKQSFGSKLGSMFK